MTEHYSITVQMAGVSLFSYSLFARIKAVTLEITRSGTVQFAKLPVHVGWCSTSTEIKEI